MSRFGQNSIISIEFLDHPLLFRKNVKDSSQQAIIGGYCLPDDSEAFRILAKRSPNSQPRDALEGAIQCAAVLAASAVEAVKSGTEFTVALAQRPLRFESPTPTPPRQSSGQEAPTP